MTAAAIRQVRKEHEQRAQPQPPPRPTPPRPAPRPAPVQVIPVAAQQVFNLITQAAEEARALGGADVFRGEISADVRHAWAVELAADSRAGGPARRDVPDGAVSLPAG